MTLKDTMKIKVGQWIEFQRDPDDVYNFDTLKKHGSQAAIVIEKITPNDIEVFGVTSGRNNIERSQIVKVGKMLSERDTGLR